MKKPQLTNREKWTVRILILFGIIFMLLETTNVHAALTDGLVMYYKADEGSGNLLTDSKGFLNATRYSGSAVVSTASKKLGISSLYSDATGGFWTGTQPSNYTLQLPYTVNMWVNVSNTASKTYYLHSWGKADTTTINYLTITTTNQVCILYGSSSGNTDKYCTGANNITANTFYMITYQIVADGVVSIYVNGVNKTLSYTQGGSGSTPFTGSPYPHYIAQAGQYASDTALYIDEFGFWNRTLNQSEINESLYNGNNGSQYPFNSTIIETINNISFITRFPSDITNTVLFNYPTANITYQYYIPNLTQSYVNYSLFSYGTTCVNYHNGTCRQLNGTWYNRTQLNNITNGNYSNITFSFTENDIYPATSNINSTQISAGITNIVLSGNNNFYADEILNLSNSTQYNIYEIPLLSSGVVEVYYYNSSYDFGSNPLTSSNVHLLCTYISPTSYNHSHGSYGHQLCPYTVNSSGYVGLTKFNGGGFLVRGNTQGVNLTLLTTGVRNNVLRFTNNGGNTWTSYNTPLVSHVHQYTSTDTINFKGIGVFAGVTQATTITSDNLDITPLQPEAPTIMIPNGTGTYTKYMNITWEQAISTSPNAYISNYTLQVFDSNLNQLYNITTVSNTTFNYVWTTYNFNLTVNTPYIIGIKANQNNSLSTYSFSGEFTVTTNSEINISAKAYNLSTINNFTISLFNNTYLSNYSTNTGNLLIDIIKGNTYTYLIQAPGFEYKNITLTNTNITSQYQFLLYTKNSMNISIFNEITKSLILNSQLELISDAYSNNYSTTTGRYYIDLLSPSSYSIRYSSPGYSTRTYEFTLLDNSYNELNLTLLNNSVSSNVTIVVLDNLGNKLPDAIVKIKKFDLATNTYPIDQIVTTNFEGKTTADIILNTEYYKFIIEYNDEVVLSTDRSYIYGTTLTFQVSLSGAGFDVVFENEMLSGNITTTNNNIAKFSYNDESNTATQACFKIYSLNTINKILYNSSCSVVTSGDISLSYSNTTHSTYVMEGYITISNREYLVATKTINLAENLPEQGKGFGLLITFILMIVTIFMLRFSLPVAVIVGSSIPLFMSMTHLNSISVEASSGVLLLGLVIAYFVGSR